MKTDNKLSLRHFKQIVTRPRAMKHKMRNIWSLGFRPGDKTGNFLGKAFRPLESCVAVVQTSYQSLASADGRASDREQVLLAGFKARVDTATGIVYWGGASRNCFAYDMGVKSHPGGTGYCLDPEKQTQLVLDGLAADKLRQNAVVKAHQLKVLPRLPEVFFGFAKDDLPEVEDTPALRSRVAHRMGMNLEAFNRYTDVEIQCLLQVEWPSVAVAPGGYVDEQRQLGFNSTTLYLISQQFTSAARRAKQFLAYFEPLLGVDLYNPARDLNFAPELPAIVLPNPAKAVAEQLQLDIEKCPDFDETQCQAMLDGMRTALPGRVVPQLTQDLLFDAIVNSEAPLTLPAVPVNLTDADIVCMMRLSMQPHISECCTDQDCFNAARRPSAPLYASGMCKTQVLHASSLLGRKAAFAFSPETLEREAGISRVHVDFGDVAQSWVVRPYETEEEIDKRLGAESHAVMPAVLPVEEETNAAVSPA